MNQNKIRIAIQKDGRLRNLSIEYLNSLGLKFSKDNTRRLIVPCKDDNVEILFVRHSDIPKYIQNGIVDFGIVGSNLLYEKKFDIKEIKKLDFGKCDLVIAIPLTSSIQNVQDLDGQRIATSYPNSLRKFLHTQKINASIIEINGSVEIAPLLNLSDAICDLTQTGNSLKENNLKILNLVFNSTAVLIGSKFESIEKIKFINKFFIKSLY